ncbi:MULTISPECIES: LLM class flavin-dependent oxidoreductase [Cobetia]|uniref:LLM class flavin-dependent oxidoreductase n=1 Tax=Cobetia TaxID=204286 RepID=UPI00178CA066|nr:MULTISPECIES: LLM class flavin-dependent oxidoreductase [Cobetia]MBE2167940.1 LLM class flavin-dependent oxidoreductase [Cobetia sp. 2AS1]MDH2420207.1 LLM class flavin-dependent oxidoreductase [Cobetia litoralis]MDH2422396.1 LLM class flavin-dependent oxidoreductase [Cobetia litoralis]MDH2446363.1 LLM class flavin-dependent oxidoreductase [Cobetia sp. 2AS]
MTTAPTSRLGTIPLSVLDLAPIRDTGSVAETFHNSVSLAQHVEALGFHRLWLAEHHNIDGIASAATSVLIGHVAGKTSRLRVGSGGIMLPNHPPLVVAEQFGTLATLYPDRIDLGLGRAPGSDGITMQAMRRDPSAGVNDFPQRLAELEQYLGEASPGQRVKAMPGQGTHVPLWLLGSSDYSARLAAKKGLPFAFAGQFAPGYMLEAIKLYRENFTPSEVLDAPYVMLGLPLIAADSDERARFLASTQQQKFLNLIRGKSTRALPPRETLDWSAREEAMVGQNLAAAIIGGPERIRSELEHLLEVTQADELMFNSDFYEHADRLKSYEILAEVAGRRTPAASQ